VLVLVPGQVVAAINVSPVNVFGEILNRGEGVRNNSFTIGEFSLLNTASTISKRLFLARVFRLRHNVNGLVIGGIILLFLSGDMLDSPVLDWGSPVAA